jgi:hypothetical protein
VSAFEAKANNNNSASIILKSWDNLSNSSKAKEWTGNMLDFAQDNSVERCQACTVNNIMQFWSYHCQNLELKAFILSYTWEISLPLS